MSPLLKILAWLGAGQEILKNFPTEIQIQVYINLYTHAHTHNLLALPIERTDAQ